MKLIQTALPEVVIIESELYEDERGSLMEIIQETFFHQALACLKLPIPPHFIQDNCVYSNKHVLRGLHYQLPPYTQDKLIHVVSGAIYDVAVDIRKNSPTFGRWIGIELNEQNHRMLWVPQGFAHGYYVLKEAYIIYKLTNIYQKSSEVSLMWNDPAISIDWPNKTPILSTKDKEGLSLGEIKRLPLRDIIPDTL